MSSNYGGHLFSNLKIINTHISDIDIFYILSIFLLVARNLVLCFPKKMEKKNVCDKH